MQFTTLLLTTLTALASTSLAAKSEGTFHVTNFHEETTDGKNFYFDFNVTLNTVPGVACHVPATAKNYVFCGVASPEQAYYAYVPPNGKAPRALFLRFDSNFPGKTSSVYGSKVVPKATSTFDVPAYGPSSPA